MTFSFTTTHGELSVALDAMTALGTNRPPVPLLAAIKMSVATSGTVTLETFDFTTHVAVTLSPSELTLADETVLVNRALLTFYIRSLTAGSTKAKQAGLPITISHDGGTEVLVEADGYHYTLPTMGDVTEFPQTPVYSTDKTLTLDRDTMRTTVTRLQITAGDDDSLPMLTGINFRSVPGGLELCTTDRFRLGIAFIAAQRLDEDVEVKALVPAKVLATIFRYLPAGPVLCGFSAVGASSMAWFRSGVVLVGTTLLDNEFVKYQSLIPSKGRGDVVVVRADLATAVKRAATTVDRGHHIRFRFAGSTVSVEAGGDEGKMSSPSFRTEQHGEDLVGMIAFNPGYIGDALAVFGSDAVSIRYDTASRPVLIAEPGELDNPRAFRTMLMPARLPT